MHLLIVSLIFTLYTTTTLAGNGCSWSEASQFGDAMDELDASFDDFDSPMNAGKGINFSFKDAVSCRALSNVQIRFRQYKGRTNSSGKVTVPMKYFKGINDKRITLTARHRNYINYKIEIPVLLETTWQNKFLLTKKLKNNQARFVLQWADKPRDLDLHLIGSNGMHISYRHTKSQRNLAKLDRDDTDGFGPETITLKNIQPNVKYTVKVHSYSGEPFQGKASVAVYLNRQLKEVIYLPHSQKRMQPILEFEKNRYQSLR